MPAPQAAYPELRRAKARGIRERVARGMEARADQAEVWDEVACKRRLLRTESPTGAMHDIYELRRDRLSRVREAIRLQDGQAGALVTIGGRFAVLDLVSDPDTFAFSTDRSSRATRSTRSATRHPAMQARRTRTPPAASLCSSPTASQRSAPAGSDSVRSCASRRTALRARRWSTRAS